MAFVFFPAGGVYYKPRQGIKLDASLVYVLRSGWQSSLQLQKVVFFVITLIGFYLIAGTPAGEQPPQVTHIFRGER